MKASLLIWWLDCRKVFSGSFAALELLAAHSQKRSEQFQSKSKASVYGSQRSLPPQRWVNTQALKAMHSVCVGHPSFASSEYYSVNRKCCSLVFVSDKPVWKVTSSYGLSGNQTACLICPRWSIANCNLQSRLTLKLPRFTGDVETFQCKRSRLHSRGDCDTRKATFKQISVDRQNTTERSICQADTGFGRI